MFVRLALLCLAALAFALGAYLIHPGLALMAAGAVVGFAALLVDDGKPSR